MAAFPRPRIRTWALAAAVSALLAALLLVRTDAGAASGDLHTDLAADINPGSSSSLPGWFAVAGSTLFFQAQSAATGAELHKITAAGVTSLVKDIDPAGSSYPDHLVAVGNRVFFTAAVGGDRELYVSDGTPGGTHRTRNINTQTLYGFTSSNPQQLTNVNGTLYFTAEDTQHDRELWKSDGTGAGTVRVRNILNKSLGGPNGESSMPDYLTVIGDTLYFTAYGLNGNYLWKSDGTWDGTVKVSTRATGDIRNLAAVGNTLYFSEAPWTTGTYGAELWKSDGTGAGTVMVRNIASNPGQGSAPADMLAVGNTLYFSAGDNSGDRELWKSNGTTAGTVRVKNINTATGDPSQSSSNPYQLTDVNGTLFFVATTDYHRKLYKSDGTAAGTVMMPQTFEDGSDEPAELTPIGGQLFYRSVYRVDAANQADTLFVTDGTVAGTRPVGSPQWVTGDNEPGGLTNFNGTLYFRDWDYAHGKELWRVTIEP